VSTASASTDSLTLSFNGEAFGGTVTVTTTAFSGEIGTVTVTTTVSADGSAAEATSIAVTSNPEAFGGVVGAVPVTTYVPQILISSDRSLSSSDLITAAPATVIVTSFTTLVIDTIGTIEFNPLATSSPADFGNGAFGGVVGSQAPVTNLVSTASSFAGFGGVVGFATPVTESTSHVVKRAKHAEMTPPGCKAGVRPGPTHKPRIKRDVFSISIDLNSGIKTGFSAHFSGRFRGRDREY
jgi:hypothetical protein